MYFQNKIIDIGITHNQGEEIHDSMKKLQTLVGGIQHQEQNHSKETHRHKIHLRHHHHHHHHRTRHLPHALPPFDDEEDSSYTNGQRNDNKPAFDDEEDDETSRESDQTTTVGACPLCPQEKTEDVTTKQSNARHSITTSNYTDRSYSLATTSGNGGPRHNRRLGEALASNGTDIIYYDYEQEMICIAGAEEYSVKFNHGLVVDLYWWALNGEWLILSEQGLYRWKAGEPDYRDEYEFSNGEIGFRRIAVTSTSIFCLFRYSLMLLELSNSMQMKRLHALAPPDPRYRKLADISVRKMIQRDGSEEDILGIAQIKYQ